MRTGFGVLFALLVALSALPLLTLLGRLPGHLDLLALLVDAGNLRAVGETLQVALYSLGLAVLLAVPLAWLLTRTDLPGQAIFRRALLFPYFIPPFIFAIAWIMLGLPRIGLLNRIAGVDWLDIYSRGGLIWVLSNAYLPLILAPVCQAMETMDPSLEEAARVCGATPARTFFGITLPCLLPSVASAALLFMLSVLSAFGIPALVGNPARKFVLTTKIYTYAKMGGLNGTDRAFVLSLWLFLFTLVFVGINEWVRRRYQYRLTSGKAARPSKVALGLARWPLWSLVLCLCVVLVVLPLVAIFLSSFLAVAGDLRPANFSLRNYEYLFQMPEAGRALVNSIGLALATAAICTVLGFFVAYYHDRSRLPLRRALSRLATFPFAVPGTILALALVVSFGAGWGIAELALLGSPLLLLIAYISKYLALSVQSLTPALSHIDPSLDEAGRISGATPGRVIRAILLPLLKPTLASVFVLTALPVLSELTMSVLLVGAGTETLGTLLFQLQDYANPLAACSLSALLVLFLAGVVGALR